MSRLDTLRAEATRDEDGRLIHERKVTGPAGNTTTVETDLTALLNTPPRTSGHVDLLVTEAELVAEGAALDNPARPANADIAEDVVARLDEDVRPAWEVVGE